MKSSNHNPIRKFAPGLLFTLATLLLCSCSTPQRDQFIRESDYESPIRVACVGDSITFGSSIPDRDHNSYPAQLAALLGPHWEVRNFGVSGATLLKQGNKPYCLEPAFREALNSRPDVVIIKLGTNDSKPGNWRHKDQFLNDCVALIREFQQLETRPRIYLCRPVPAFPERWGIRDDVIRQEIIPLIDQAAEQTGVQVIDLYNPLIGHPELFPDQIHPNAQGAGWMARIIFTALTGRQAGLKNQAAAGSIP